MVRNIRFLSTLVLVAFFALVSACRSGEVDDRDDKSWLLDNESAVVKKPQPRPTVWGGSKEDSGQWGESSQPEMVDCRYSYEGVLYKHGQKMSKDTCLANALKSAPELYDFQQEHIDRLREDARKHDSEELEKVRRAEENKRFVERLTSCFKDAGEVPVWRQDIEKGVVAAKGEGPDLLQLLSEYEAYHNGYFVHGKDKYPCYDDAESCVRKGKDCEFSELAKKYVLERDTSFVKLLWRIVNSDEKIEPKFFCIGECFVMPRQDLVREMLNLIEVNNLKLDELGIKVEDVVSVIKRGYEEHLKFATQDIVNCDPREDGELPEGCDFLIKDVIDARQALCTEDYQKGKVGSLTRAQIDQLKCEDLDD